MGPAVSCSGDQEKNGNKNETHGKISVRNRWDRRQHRAADLPVYPMFTAPIPSFASSIMRTHASASPDSTKTEPLLTRHSPSVCTRAAYAINKPFPPSSVPMMRQTRLQLSVPSHSAMAFLPRAQCRSIRKNCEHSLRVKSPSLQYSIDITAQGLLTRDASTNSTTAAMPGLIPWHIGTKYRGPRKGKMVNAHHIHCRRPLFEAARRHACAGLVKLSLSD
jgi:hypothetical protein